jgi:hypothetical protein
VRVRWDPERSLQLDRLRHRAIQVGLGGEAVGRYIDERRFTIRRTSTP